MVVVKGANPDVVDHENGTMRLLGVNEYFHFALYGFRVPDHNAELI